MTTHNVHPIFARIISGFAPHLDALEPRYCSCGEPTGSVALEKCEACEPPSPARSASEYGAHIAFTAPTKDEDIRSFRDIAARRDCGEIDNEAYDKAIAPILLRAERGRYVAALLASVRGVNDGRSERR